jgi:hypothetical protein
MRRLTNGKALRAQSGAGIGGFQERVIQREPLFQAPANEPIGLFDLFICRTSNSTRAAPRIVRLVWQALERGVISFVVSLRLLRVRFVRLLVMLLTPPAASAVRPLSAGALCH